MAGHAAIEAYIAALPPALRDVATAACAAIDRTLPDGWSAIRWSHPTWSVGAAPDCYLKAESQHLTVGFWYGQSIADPSGRLESTGSIMAHATLRAVEDVNEAPFADWLRQARELTLSDAR